jgi:hypothetical protein
MAIVLKKRRWSFFSIVFFFCSYRYKQDSALESAAALWAPLSLAKQ